MPFSEVAVDGSRGSILLRRDIFYPATGHILVKAPAMRAPAAHVVESENQARRAGVPRNAWPDSSSRARPGR